MDAYLPLQGTVADLDMNAKKILGLSKADGQIQDEAVSYECMQEYVQSQTPASDMIKTSDETCKVQATQGGIEYKHSNSLLCKQYYEAPQPGDMNEGKNVIDAQYKDNKLIAYQETSFVVDRPGFDNVTTFVTRIEENANYAIPTDRTGTDLFDQKDNRLAT